jgi:hypothetical protein
LLISGFIERAANKAVLKGIGYSAGSLRSTILYPTVSSASEEI